MSDRNKIAQSLSVEQLDEFVTALAAKPGKERTLEAIKHLAAVHGITISLMSAKAFRDTTFDRYLERIRRAQEVALQVENIDQGGSTMADASAKLLSKRIFDQLVAAEDEDSESEIDVGPMALAVSRLRIGDQRNRALEAKLRETEAKLREYDRKQAEYEEKQRQARAEMQKLREPAAANDEERRQAILDEVDRIMGLKK